jgi:magnesium chelatase family protein
MNLPRRSVVVNMAPADIKKEGAAFDLPIAVGLLAAGEVIQPVELDSYMIMGELSLDGHVRPVRGILPMAIQARKAGFKYMIVPEENATEAAVVNDITVYGVKNIVQVLEIVQGFPSIGPTVVDTRAEFAAAQQYFDFDFSEVKGQENVKRAFEVACAGGHNILLVGPPGSGKSMMAKRLPSILPPLTLREALETTKIHSVAGRLKQGSRLLTHRPFRSPHHTVSPVALVGGGSNPKPGEISLAHNGVLFLDELPEFSRTVLEVMRQPLEDRHITVSRAKYNVDYPASFMLVASMNPCPCGYYNHPTKACTCLPGAVNKYLGKISGPLLDRIDLQVEILPVPFEKLADAATGEPSAAIRERVVKARAIQAARFADEPAIHCNAQMNSRLLQRWCQLSKESSDILQHAMIKFDMSARAYDRILKVSRTIADLDNSDEIMPHHMSEAVNYRNLDRSNWGTTI